MRTCALLGFLALVIGPAVLRGQDVGPEPVRLSLDEAIEIALSGNPGLAQAEANRDLASANRLSAIGAFLPSLDLNYGFTTSKTPRVDPTGQTLTETSHSAQWIASYDLFTGFRRTSAYRSAVLDLDAENAYYREQEFETIEAVKEAYFTALAVRDLRQVEVDRVRRQVDQLEFVQRQMALGRATRSDELRSSVDLNNARLGLLNAENAVRESGFELARVVGVDEFVEPDPASTLEIEPLTLSRDEVVAMALETGPAIVAARASADAAGAAVAQARSEYYPSLNLRGGQSWRNDEFPPKDASWSVTVAASYPLFNGFQRETSVRRSRAQADLAAAGRRTTELAVRADVDAAYSRIESAREAMTLAQATVALAEEDLRVTHERYEVGLATILDLQTSQIALRQAEVDLIQRRFDYALGIAQLEGLIGRSLR